MNQFLNKQRVEKFLFAVLLLAIGIIFTCTDGLKRWDRSIYDLLSGGSVRTPPDDIVIISIDEASLARFGRWPWPRCLHADLIDKLSRGGAKVIGFDIVIAEAGFIAPEDDQALAAAIARSGRVILPVICEAQPGNPLRLTPPLPDLAGAAAGLGHIVFELDSDGIMRRTFLKAGLGSPDWPGLSLAMLQFSDAAFVENLPGVRNRNLHSASPANWVRDYQILIPFADAPGFFPRISYAHFLEPDCDANVVRGKFVFVGATALGLGDALPTPVSGENVPMSGVEINANLLDTLRNGIAIEPLGSTQRLLLTCLLLLLPVFFYPRLRLRLALSATILLMILTICISVLLLKFMHLWFAPAPAFLGLALSYPLWTWSRLERIMKTLFKEKECAQVTLRSIGDGVITTDSRGRIQYMNPAAETLTGYKEEEAHGCLLGEIFPLLDERKGKDRIDIVEQCLEEKQIVQLPDDGSMIDRFGDKHVVRVSAGPIHDETGRSMGAVLGVSDITETRQALQQIAYQTTHDTLTGLPNRSLLCDRLKQAIVNAHRSGNYIAVLLIDLDYFKKVNDRLGHSGGQRLLEMVASRLQSGCREADTVARIGGDEFVILLENINNAETVATVAGKLKNQLVSPFVVDGRELYVTGSMGISIFPKDGNNVESLLKHADTAMYRVKETGRDNLRFFSSEMNELIQKRLQMEKKLRAALNNNEFQLYYQPQVRLRDGLIIGVEALLRWKISEHDFIPPADFIPVAEECGLINPLGEWVFRTSCRQAKKWQDQGFRSLRMAVNISPKQFLDRDIADMLARTIDESQLNPMCLDLEITEGLIMQDVERSISILHNFRELGGRVAIDDFGTGYSSLAYLKQFPVDKLKIDRSFVRDLQKDKKDAALAKAIINMGHGLELNIVAEGVESRAQLAILEEQQCDEIQGYFFSHPLPEKEMTDLLQKKPFLKRKNS